MHNNAFYSTTVIRKRALIISLLGVVIFRYVCTIAVTRYVMSWLDLMDIMMSIASVIIMIVYMAMNHKSNSGRILFCVSAALVALNSLVFLSNLSTTLDNMSEYEVLYIVSLIIRNVFGMITFAILAILPFFKKPLRGLKISLCTVFAALVLVSSIIYRVVLYCDYDFPMSASGLLENLMHCVLDLLFVTALIVYFVANRTYGPDRSSFVPAMPYSVPTPMSLEQSLLSLKASYERGEISEEDYQILRQDILGRL